MTTAVLACQKRIQSKVESMDFVWINWKIVCFFGLAMALCLLVFYACQINILTRGYYLINSYEKEISSLLKENKNLEFVYAQSDVWGQTMERIRQLNFQKTTAVKYIQVLDASVAKK